MTTSDINSFCNFRASTDTTLYPNSDRLISLNRWLHKIWSIILASVDDWDIDDPNNTDYAIITTPLIANQRDYTLPASLKAVKIKRVDVTYDGTNYYKCELFDSGTTGEGLGSNSNTDARYSKTSPRYDLQSNAIFLYPLPTAADVSAGAKLRVEYSRELIEFTLSDLTGGTKVPSVDEPFHMMLALGLTFDYAAAKRLSDIKTDTWAELQDYEARLKKQYGTKNKDDKYVLTSAFIDYE